MVTPGNTYILASFFGDDEETKAKQGSGMPMAVWLVSSRAGLELGSYDRCLVPWSFFHPMAASQVPWRTSKPGGGGERVEYNNNNSKINNGSFSVCYVLNAILITLYAPFLRLLVISEGCHYYPHLKKKQCFRQHKRVAHRYTDS